MNPTDIFQIFPQPILGVILLFEGITLIMLFKDILTNKKNFFIALVVGLIANGIPWGYIIGMIIGTALYYLPPDWILKDFGKH